MSIRKKRTKRSLVGRRFGRLTVVRLLKGYKCRVHCSACDKQVTRDKRGLYRSKSCGCIRGKSISISKTKHGAKREGFRSPEYTAWINIKSRCNNPKNQDYADYGGRGIKFCPHFEESFITFLSAVGKRRNSRLSTDRIDNDLGYLCSICCPPKGNVRWATATQQRMNQRRQLKKAA